MPGLIRQDDVEAVRERADLVKVVSGYLQLKKSGRDSMAGLCPFHPEKTPSFSVSPSKQVYYCFGCGEGGNVYRFLEKIENLTFPEVVERLAKETGVTLRYEGETQAGRQAAGRRERLYRANEEAGRLYQRMLLDGREAAEARDYLAQRGISKESVERFGVGYAPLYADFLLRRMTKTLSPELLVEAGLVAKDGAGTLRDRFRGRVVFPIHDLSGKAVGFGGRLLQSTGLEGAKYVNSPDTPVYHKGTLLYNLDRAKAEIQRTRRAFLVEGYTDVIALDSAGIASAVATCGTALGDDHLRLLSRFTERVVLAFDSDDAGARAAERAYQFHQRYAVDILVLILPEGQDPADFVLARGAEAGTAFLEMADRAVPLVEYMIERILRDRPLDDVEERARAVRAALELVVPLEDPVRRQSYARVVAGRTGERENAVMLELERMVAPAGQGAASGPARPAATRMPPHQKVEREALKLLVQAPDLCPPETRSVDGERFATPSYRRIFEFIQESSPGGAPGIAPDANGGRVADLVTRAQDRGEQLGRLVAALAVEPAAAGGEPTRGYAEAVFLRLEEFWLTRRIDALRRDLERLNPQKAPDEYERMFGELIGMEGRRRRIRVSAEASGAAL